MDVLSQSPTKQGEQPADPRLQPTPDYGTLGPDSDINASATRPNARPILPGPIIALAVGGFLAALVAGAGSAGPALKRVMGMLSSGDRRVISAKDFSRVNRTRAQKEAENLLQLAIANSDSARDQIFARADGWRGKLKWDAQIAALFTAALNSKDSRVRGAGIEVELAAYGLAKNAATVDYLVREADSPDHAEKIWGLWALGLMANRGIETERVVGTLTSHLKDSDEESRRWAVEALALVGTTPTIGTLLETMHDDPSALVRERAACSLAESGMLTREQRLSAVPKLMEYSDDSSLDAQTRAWAFRALGEITGQRLANDSAAWRKWYENHH